ncbi:hypothetical protein [Magnetospirillum sp. SS-4]|uniref:hypothetical protein n=1 Tax=Magnetospirillum sp. SS-4 TaxID=2681465 RepID=UPI001385CCDD|nr:hypothetical protein [Magnetospirillum sp. SS-4]CAA7613920.1 hypothetical protein MTBSS4_100160 [Magnetospirillum sp. SS-4]
MRQDEAGTIDRLAMLLDDEASGRPFDPLEAIRLAQDVSRIIPEIAPFMSSLIGRMKSRHARMAAA